MTENNLAPVRQTQRIAIIDILRGWALLGVVLMNYHDYYFLGFDWKHAKPDPLSSSLMGFAQFFFSGKSWTLLSVLFGYGFSMLMNNVESKGISPNAFFTRRMFWLLMIAIVNSSFFFGDILKDYAVMGMLMLPFRHINAKKAGYISIALLVAVPAVVGIVNHFSHANGLGLIEPFAPLLQSHHPLKVLWFGLKGTAYFEFVNLNYLFSVHTLMLSLFFLGMAIQKSGFLQHIHEQRKNLFKIIWLSIGTTLAVILCIGVSQQMKWNWLKYYNPYHWVTVGTMIFIAATICLLYVRGKMKDFFESMQVIGKMTLTNYIMQNFLALFLFSGIGLGFVMENRIHYGYYIAFALVIYIAQVYFSKWWLSKFYYGPVEWLWRQLSYQKSLPLRKKDTDEITIESTLNDLEALTSTTKNSSSPL